MELVKNDRSELEAASIRLAVALYDAGYITERDSQSIIHRVTVGDKTAYRDLKDVLVLMADEVGRA